MGGPAGAVAGQLIKKAMGVDPSQDIEDALANATLTPEGIEKIRLAEIELKKFEADNGFKFEQLEAEDRKDARNLAIQTSILPQVALSVLFVLGYFVILSLFFAQELRIPMNEAFMVMLGVLTAGVPQVMAFWLGSSAGSKTKTDALAALTKE